MEGELDICDFNAAQVEIFNVDNYSYDDNGHENTVISLSDDEDENELGANLPTFKNVEQKYEAIQWNESNTVNKTLNVDSIYEGTETVVNNPPLVVIQNSSNHNQIDNSLITQNAPPKKKRRKSTSMLNSKSFLDLIRKSNNFGNLEFRCRLCNEVFQHALTFANHYKSDHTAT